jgi:hypothetical protein
MAKKNVKKEATKSEIVSSNEKAEQVWWQKKWLQIVFVVVIILGIVLAIIAFWPKNKAVESKSTNFVLIKEKGEVEYKVKDNGNYIGFTGDEISIPTGSTVKTKLDALAHILMPDNSLISLDKDTELKVDITDAGNKFNQLVGSTWHRVEKVASGSYQVNTPNALATVRGTIFGVELSAIPDELTGVYVVESKVDVESKIDDSLTELTPKQLIEIGSEKIGKIIRKGILIDPGGQGRWYVRNYYIDQLWKEGLKLEDILKFKDIDQLKDSDENNKLPTLKENCLNLLEEKNRDALIGAYLNIGSDASGKVLPAGSSISATTDSFNPCTKLPFPASGISWKLNDQDKGKGDKISIENLNSGDYILYANGKDGSYTASNLITFKIDAPVLPPANSTTRKIVKNIQPNVPAVIVNQAPTAFIRTPNNGDFFQANFNQILQDPIFFKANFSQTSQDPFATVSLNGSGTDPEDGNLAGSSLVWKANGVVVGTGNSVNVDLITTFSCSAGSGTTYLIELTATDSKGLSSVVQSVIITVDFDSSNAC